MATNLTRCVSSLGSLMQTSQFSTSPACLLIKWRIQKGLHPNPNHIDAINKRPDYSFRDGRPVPLSYKQKIKLLRQRKYAEKIVELCGDIDFALEAYGERQEQKKQLEQDNLDKRLKEKGKQLSGKSQNGPRNS